MTPEEILQALYDETLVGNGPRVLELTEEGLGLDMEPQTLLFDALIPSLEEVGARFGDERRTQIGGKGEVEAEGATLGEILAALDRRYPGLRFRIITEQDTIREHIRIFVNEGQARDLSTALRPNDQIHILCALSGG